MNRQAPGRADDFDGWQGSFHERRYPNGRGWKTALAYLAALICFPLFFIGLFWLMAGAPLP